MYHCESPKVISWSEDPYVWKNIKTPIERDLYFQYDLKLRRARVNYLGSWYSWTEANFFKDTIIWTYTDKFTYIFKKKLNLVIEKQNYLYLKFEDCKLNNG